MKISLAGPSSQQRSLPWDAQRSINLFPIIDQAGKDSAALYSIPGLRFLGTAGSGPGRGGFNASNGRLFQMSGADLYEVLADNTSIKRGTTALSNGTVTIAENGFQLAVCDGINLYIFTYATNAFIRVNVAGLPSAASVDFIDGYFIVNRSSNSGIFQISGLYDGTTWNALDFATAESSPDSLLRVLNVTGQLWLFGAKTVEIWYNNGAASFPFARIAGGKMEVGIGSPYSAIAIDNSAIWIGKDAFGSNVVYRAEGFTPKAVSTEPISILLGQSDISNVSAYAYQEDQHTFVVFTGAGLKTSPTLDLSTNQWHERASLENGIYTPHPAANVIYAFGKQIAFDRRNGNFYEQSLNYYDFNGAAIVRDRIFTHLLEENQRIQYRNLTVGFEVGVGTEAGLDPKATLFISRDGGRTWSGGISKSIGKIGEYFKRVIWHRLGQARECTFRIRVTDPVKVAISGAWVNT